MKEINVQDVIPVVERLCIESCTLLGEDWWQAIDQAIAREESTIGRDILSQLKENARLAATTSSAICQDTGIAVIFVELGQDVRLTGGNLYDAINEGVRRGYTKGYLRKSVLNDPLIRKNTGDNTPAIIHTHIVNGDFLKITVAPKGAGSENVSGVKMLKPSEGVEGIKRYVLQMVEEAGGNTCPPTLVGVGIGGDLEEVALLAKKALLRPLLQRHPLPHIAQLEEELLTMINKTGIGPQALGGRITALDVHIEVYPTHIACLPVAVNFQCHAVRHAEAVL
ncbi:fumarate hydratase [Neomoorella mulderi]|uniref:L(+)-tartrate dehydratase subunit alpha n=1 Tax=Moorella mulderi DSM 14980 TaxID=1122241 RepID=A0A151AUG8_9FIRM|nr:fumarate hydratase [Moorella mulderi]KYH31285.1 L(+)-tartrate dehydratase subunit alpha [Moorella mulderi DSM 14980]